MKCFDCFSCTIKSDLVGVFYFTDNGTDSSSLLIHGPVAGYVGYEKYVFVSICLSVS